VLVISESRSKVDETVGRHEGRTYLAGRYAGVGYSDPALSGQGEPAVVAG
jgi:hypothetical protein